MECTQVLYDDSFEESENAVKRDPIVEGTLEVNGTSFEVMTGENIIGRDPGLSSIVLEFQAISAEHAKLEAGPDGHTLCDLGSRNKTRLKERVLKPYVNYFIEDGDVIMFADVKAVYHISPAVVKEKTDKEECHDVIPETPAKPLRRHVDDSMVIPESPDVLDETDFDDSFLPCSQPVINRYLKNICTTSETSFVASSHSSPISKSSTSGTLTSGNGELEASSIPERESSINISLRSSLENQVESQASLRLALSESLADNESLSRSLDCSRNNSTLHEKPKEDEKEGDTEVEKNISMTEVEEARGQSNSTSENIDGEDRSIYEAKTQVIPESRRKQAEPGCSIYEAETQFLEPQSPDSGSSTPDLGESAVYRTDKLSSPDSFKEPANPNVRKLGLSAAKIEEEQRNGSPEPEEKPRSESLFEANTQLIFSSETDSPRRGRQVEENGNGVLGGEEKPLSESVYEADTQLIFPPETASPRTKRAVEENRAGTPDRKENESIYEADTQLTFSPETGSPRIRRPLEENRNGTPDHEKNLSESLYETDTQVIHSPDSFKKPTGRSARKQVKFTRDELQENVAGSRNVDSECEQENELYKAETQVLPVSEKEDAGSLYEAETQLLPRIAGKETESIYEVETQVIPLHANGRQEQEDDRMTMVEEKSNRNADVEDCSPQSISGASREETSKLDKCVEKGRDGTRSEKANAVEEDEEETLVSGEQVIARQTEIGAGRSEAIALAKPSSDDDTDEEDFFSGPNLRVRKEDQKGKMQEKKSTSADRSASDDESIFDCPTQALPRDEADSSKSSVLALDSDGIDCEDISDCATQKLPRFRGNESESITTCHLSRDDAASGNAFECPPQEVSSISKSLVKSKKESKSEDDTDEENIVDRPAPKLHRKSGRKEDKSDGDDTDNESIFDRPTQMITAAPKLHQRSDRKEDKSDGDDTDNESIFDRPTQMITAAPKLHQRSDRKGEKSDGDDTDNESIFDRPTQMITAAPKLHQRSDRKEDKSDGDDTDNESIFDRPTQMITAAPKLHQRSDRKGEKSDGDDIDNESIFNHPTQMKTAAPKLQTGSKEKEGKSGGDDTDNENLFDCPTQTITTAPKLQTGSKEKEGKSDGDDTDSENILDCATQAIRSTAREQGRSTVTDGSNSEKIVDDNSNDSETLLQDYEEDDFGNSPLPDDLHSPIVRTTTPDEMAAHARDSTPDLMNGDTSSPPHSPPTNEELLPVDIDQNSSSKKAQEEDDVSVITLTNEEDQLCSGSSKSEPLKDITPRKTTPLDIANKEFERANQKQESSKTSVDKETENLQEPSPKRDSEERLILGTSGRRMSDMEVSTETKCSEALNQEDSDLTARAKSSSSEVSSGITTSKRRGTRETKSAIPSSVPYEEQKEESSNNLTEKERNDLKGPSPDSSTKSKRRTRGKTGSQTLSEVPEPQQDGKLTQKEEGSFISDVKKDSAMVEKDKPSEKETKRGWPKKRSSQTFKASLEEKECQDNAEAMSQIEEKSWNTVGENGEDGFVEKAKDLSPENDKEDEILLPETSGLVKSKRGRPRKTSFAKPLETMDKDLVEKPSVEEKLKRGRSRKSSSQTLNSTLEEKESQDNTEAVRPIEDKSWNTAGENGEDGFVEKAKNLSPENDKEDEILLPETSGLVKSKRGRPRKTSFAKPLKTMDKDLVEKPSVEENLKRGRPRKSSSQTLNSTLSDVEIERQDSVKLGQKEEGSNSSVETEDRLVQKELPPEDDEKGKLVQESSDCEKPKRGRSRKTGGLKVPDDEKLSQKEGSSTTFKEGSKRRTPEDDSDESPRPKKGRPGKKSSQMPNASLSEDLSLKAKTQQDEKQSRKGKESWKTYTGKDDAVYSLKKPSPEDNSEEKRSKRLRTSNVNPYPSQEQSEPIREKVRRSKKRLYSPRVPDKLDNSDLVEERPDLSKKKCKESSGSVHEDQSEETLMDVQDNDDLSSEDAFSGRRTSGRMKKPTWKIRGGDDEGLKKKLVLSYSQDTEDAVSEEDSSRKTKSGGRSKTLTGSESPPKGTDSVNDAGPSSGCFRQPSKTPPKRNSSVSKKAKPSPPKSKGANSTEEAKKRPTKRASAKASVRTAAKEELDDDSSFCSESSTASSTTSSVASSRVSSWRRLDISQSVSTLLTRSSSIISETLSPSSRRSVQRQNTKRIHRVLFTGFADGKLEKIVLQLGGKIVDSIDEATLAVTDKLRRTVKLLSMMARGMPIVSPDWILQSDQAGQFQDPWSFLLSDTESEKKFKFSMEKSLRAASNRKLLDAYTVFVTKSVSPPPDAMEDIISSSGGVMVSKPPTRWPEKSVIISCLEDAPLLKKIKKSPPVYVAEWLLSGVLQQRLNSTDFKLLQN